MAARSSSICLSRSSPILSISSRKPSLASFPRSFPASLTSFFLLFAPEMNVSATACPAWKFCLNETPDFISSPNALAASPRPLIPCSLNTLMAAMTPLNGAMTNCRMELPTPITPLMTFWISPLEETNSVTLAITSARYPASLSMIPERKSMTGCNAAMAFLSAAIAVSLPLSSSASLRATDTRRPKVAIAGDFAIPSNPSFIPFRPPPTAPNPFLNTSTLTDMSPKASLMEFA